MAPAAKELSDALAYLQKTSSTENANLYDHLAAVIARLLDTKPTGMVDLLEISMIAKKTAFDAKETSPLVPISSAADAARSVAAAGMFGNPDPPIDPETGEPVDVDAPNEYECEDVVGDGQLFDAVGVGLGRDEMYAVGLAVKKLGEDPTRGVATVRFFGKLLGLHGDYYVFETTLNDMPEVPEAPEGTTPNEAGTGVNGYVYFVASYLGGPLTQLPFVTPEQIKAARLIKKFLTGRLTSHVSTYPVFPGTEANYLRAQIARISATTVIAPNGLFTAEEDGAISKSEDFTPLSGREYSQLGSWCHRYPHLKSQGRCELFVREAPEGEEDTWEPSPEEQEEGPGPLTGLEEDTPVGGPEDPAWTPLVSSSNENVKNQVGGLRSNLWPGAYAAAKDSHFANIYVGWGIKNAPFIPLPPPPVAKEFDFALVESQELPPKPKPEAEEGEGDE